MKKQQTSKHRAISALAVLLVLTAMWTWYRSEPAVELEMVVPAWAQGGASDGSFSQLQPFEGDPYAKTNSSSQNGEDRCTLTVEHSRLARHHHRRC